MKIDLLTAAFVLSAGSTFVCSFIGVLIDPSYLFLAFATGAVTLVIIDKV